MKSVLIITYYWPPASSPGVYRFLKFAKYLPEYGWEPIILTVKSGSYPAIDSSLLAEIPSGIKTYTTPTLEPFSIFNFLTGKKGKSVPVEITPGQMKASLKNKLIFWIRANLFIPDARIGWKYFAIKKGLKIIKKNKIDAIITTGPPHSTHLIGLALQKKTGIKWVADYRDPWTNIFYNQHFPRSNRTKRIDKYLEDKVTKQADAITVISKGLKEEFQDRAKKIEIIHNGFDPIDIPEKKKIKTDLFTMAYLGNMPANRNIPILWTALKELKNEIPDFEKYFRLSLTGSVDPAAIKTIEHYGIKSMISFRDYIPHTEATRYMTEVNLLYFMINIAPNNKLIITGKLFEYLASKTPIIAIGPSDGDAAYIIQQAGRDPMIDYNDLTNLKEQIKKHYQYWLLHNFETEITPTGLPEEFTRNFLTKKLSDLLNSLNY